jgi:hypothetical protein
MEINQQRIEDAIIADVAEKIIGEDEIYSRVKTAIDAKIDRLWKDVVQSRITTEIEAVITTGFDREYQKVDSFGGKTGPSTTIRAELEKQVGGYWNARVDSQGKPSDSSYSTTTRAEWLMTKMCAADFEGEMKKHVINVGGALKDAFRAELNSTVNKLLSEVFHVRSLGDQGKGREVIDPVAKPVAAA